MSFKFSVIHKKFICAVLCPLLSVSLLSCAGSESRSAALLRQCGRLLLGSYDAEMNYRVRVGDRVTEGNVKVQKEDSVTRVELLSPDPLSGLCAEYDTVGLPRSVEVHFLGIDTELPSAALAHLTLAFSTISDEAAGLLLKTDKKNAASFGLPDGMTGAVTNTNVGGAEICTVCNETGVPVSFSLCFENCEFYAEVRSFHPTDLGENQ